MDDTNAKGEVATIETIFHINQGHQITDEELYITEGEIPVYTGNNEIKGYWNKTIVEKKDLPCLTYPTKANAGAVFIQEKIFDANNTAVLIPRKEWRDRIVLEWFKYKLPNLFLETMTSKGGVSYLNREIVEKIEIVVPDRSRQEKEAEIYAKLTDKRDKLSKILEQINQLLSKQVVT